MRYAAPGIENAVTLLVRKDRAAGSITIARSIARESPPTVEEATEEDPVDGVEQATGTLREMVLTFYRLIPSVLIAVALLVVAWGLATVVQWVLRKTLGHWERFDAISALIRITLFLLAIAVATSIVAGDARALVGGVGLVGLALSRALQMPIESFTGWLLNSFRGYYRVGDRVEVGCVFDDVYRIDVLTTTVWEAGGTGKSVAGAQPTGAMITFPNWEVLRSNIVNYNRDFPFVWDEVTLPVTNQSDLDYAVSIVERVARAAVGGRRGDGSAGAVVSQAARTRSAGVRCDRSPGGVRVICRLLDEPDGPLPHACPSASSIQHLVDAGVVARAGTTEASAAPARGPSANRRPAP